MAQQDEHARRAPVGPDAVAAEDKVPRTARGRRTQAAILDAAEAEFGEKGFHEASISGITRRAGVALGSFYTYFNSKDAVFRALVRHMSDRVRDHVAPGIRAASPGIGAERAGLCGFIDFVRAHKDIYRIIDEAEFVDPESFRLHYAVTAERITRRLEAASAAGALVPHVSEIHAWAVMGMNVFLGLRYGVWDEDVTPELVADAAAEMLANGIAAKPAPAGPV